MLPRYPKIKVVSMKKLFSTLLVAFLFFYSCKKDDIPSDVDTDGITNIDSNASFGVVFFAQTHVQQPEDSNFKLISDRATLLKVNIVSENEKNITSVDVTLTLNGNSETISLVPPKIALEPIELNPRTIIHSFDDSFTAVIPKEWVQPGLSVVVNAGDRSQNFDNLTIGAPNKIIMNMFDVNFFTASPGDYPDGWKEELESKLPVSEIELRRLPNIIFPELIIPPRANTFAARVGSKEEYKTITGLNFDGEQGAAAQWNGALKAAAGNNGRYALFYVNIYGVHAGGQAGGFGGVGNGKSIGILHHELGHALSLPHWGDNANYPYRGTMHGIPAPEVYKDVHVGPTWAFDLPTMTFMPPTVQENSVGGVPGTYKKDPMQGGGSGDQEEGFLMRHFSDYSMNKMQNYLEGHIVINTDGGETYAKWDEVSGSYSEASNNNGVQFPVESDVEVISIMAGVSAVTPQATLVYPPVGPYISGLITLFDPNNEADRIQAEAMYCPNGGCDVSVRIVQGGITKTYMLPIALDDSADPLKGDSIRTRAVNLPARDGSVTKIELLSTPNAEINGVPANVEILDTWGN